MEEQRVYDCEIGAVRPHFRCRCHNVPAPCCNCDYLREQQAASELADRMVEFFWGGKQ